VLAIGLLLEHNWQHALLWLDTQLGSGAKTKKKVAKQRKSVFATVALSWDNGDTARLCQ